MEPRLFHDRADAGRRLATLLVKYRNRADCIVLALPRGGVVLGYEVARELGLPLDVCVVRKLGAPHQPELAMGAVAAGGVTVRNEELIEACAIPRLAVEAVRQTELIELARRECAYRGDRPMPALIGKTVLLVDDGVATGATAEAAIAALRQLGARKLVLAAGVVAHDTLANLSRGGVSVVAVFTPRDLSSVAEWYLNFDQTSDAEVIDLLGRAHPDRRESTR